MEEISIIFVSMAPNSVTTLSSSIKTHPPPILRYLIGGASHPVGNPKRKV
jgi:hypothetical protein